MPLDIMRTGVTKNLLRYAASKHCFCKDCGQVLDWTETVVVHGSVCCDTCFAKAGNSAIHKYGPKSVAYMAEILASDEFDSAHAWSIVNDTLVRGKRVLTGR